MKWLLKALKGSIKNLVKSIINDPGLKDRILGKLISKRYTIRMQHQRIPREWIEAVAGAAYDEIIAELEGGIDKI